MSPRTERILLVVLLVVSAAIRLGYFLSIKSTDLALIPILDGQAYQDWALRLLAGNWDWYQTYWLGPLYPHLLALLYLVTGPQILVPLALQFALAVLNIWLVYRLAKRVFPKPSQLVPLLAAALYAFYGPAVFYAGQLLMATLLTTLFLLIALQTMKAVHRSTPGRWFLLGLLVGVTATGRGNILFFPVFLAAWLWRQSWPGFPRTRALTAMFLGAALMIAPVTLRNILVAGDFALLTSNGGINLLIGQQAQYKGLFAHVTDRPQADFDPSLEKALEQEAGHDLKGSEVSRLLAMRAIRLFWQDRQEMPLHYLRKAYRFWNGYELPQITCYDYWRQKNLALRILLIPFALLAAAGLLGLRLLPRPGRMVLSLLIVGYFLSLLPFFPTARYRLPLVPLLVIPAAGFLLQIIQRQQGWLRQGALLLLLWACLWPGWLAFSSSEIQWQVHLHNASRASRRGDIKTVLAEGELAETARPGIADTPFQLAGHLEKCGAYSKATTALRLAADRAPKSRLVPYRLGQDLEKLGRGQEALATYTRAADLDSLWDLPLLRRGLLLRQQGRTPEALDNLRQAFMLNPGSRTIRVNYASLLAETGHTQAALALLGKLVKDEPYYVNGWFNLALTEWMSGNTKAARTHLARAASLNDLLDPQRQQIAQLKAAMDQARR